VAGATRAWWPAVAANTQKKQTLEELLESLSVPPLLLVLDGITDPHNLGACLRVANAAGAHAVIAPKDHAAGVNARVSKVASGAAEIRALFMVTEPRAHAGRPEGPQHLDRPVRKSRAEKTLFEADLPRSIAWVLGCRRRGQCAASRANPATCWCASRWAGAVESLNASVAAGICLFESVRRSGILGK